MLLELEFFEKVCVFQFKARWRRHPGILTEGIFLYLKYSS